MAGGFYISRGEKFLYYERIAPGESEKACQEVGARASFEHNLQSDEVWKLCKWAYKYYARLMKGSITWEAFNNGIAQRDFLIELMRVVESAEAWVHILEKF